MAIIIWKKILDSELILDFAKKEFDFIILMKFRTKGLKLKKKYKKNHFFILIKGAFKFGPYRNILYSHRIFLIFILLFYIMLIKVFWFLNNLV